MELGDGVDAYALLIYCSVAKSCPTLCDPVDCSMPGYPVLHYLPEFAQTHVHWVADATQPSHPLSPSFPPALNLSQHQGLFQWVGSLHQITDENLLCSTENCVNAVWWPEWEGNTKGRGCMYRYRWFTFLYSRNLHKIVKQLYCIKK